MIQSLKDGSEFSFWYFILMSLTTEGRPHSFRLSCGGSEWGSAAFFWKAPEDEYFRLCGPHIILLFVLQAFKNTLSLQTIQNQPLSASPWCTTYTLKPACLGSNPAPVLPAVLPLVSYFSVLCLGIMGSHHSPSLPGHCEDSVT